MKSILISLIACAISISKLWAQAPSISSFSPTSGSTGTSVIIKGANFNASVNKNVVYFGGVKAEITQASSNQLTVLIPKSGSSSHFNVLNMGTGLAVTSRNSFTTTYTRKDKIHASDFDIETSKKIGSAFSDLLAADLNGDGKKDLVSMNSNIKELLILQNTSDAGLLNDAAFSKTISLRTQTEPFSMAIADMDGDGKQDIVLQQFGELCIFKNNSSPTAMSFSRKDLDFVSWANRIAVADMDGDGRPDILLGQIDITILKNECLPDVITSEYFVNSTIIKADGAMKGITVSDLDLDGRQDIVVSNAADQFVSIFHNQVAGNLLDATSFVKTKLNVGSENSVAIADIDGDGKKDLMVGLRAKKYVQVYKNVYTDGVFTNESLKLVAEQDVGDGQQDIKAEDIDGDGNIDMAVASSSTNKVTICKNIFKQMSPDGPWFENFNLYNLAPKPYVLLLEDLNNDGIPDLVALDGDGTMNIRKNKESVVPEISSFSPLLGYAGTKVTIFGKNFGETIADNMVTFGGRKAQILSAKSDMIEVLSPPGALAATITVLNKNSTRTARSGKVFKTTFSAPKDMTTADFRASLKMRTPEAYLTQLMFKDIDGDGFLDFVYVNDANEVIVHKNIGDGTMQCQLFGAPLSIVSGVSGKNLVVEDFTDDGLIDVIINTASGSSFLKNKSTPGNISFEAAVTQTTSVGTFPVDMDGDGRLDLSNFRNVTTENTGSPTFKDYGELRGFPIDLDGDGKYELYNDNSYSNLKFYANLSSPGSISESTFSAVETNAGSTGSGQLRDMDNDGQKDLVNGFSYKKIRRNSETSFTIDPAVPFAPEPPNDEVTPGFNFGDFNGDGYDEAIRFKNGFINLDQDTLLIYQNRALGQPVPAYTSFFKLNARNGYDTSLSSTPFIPEVVDLNNDNRPDLVIWDSHDRFLMIYENMATPQDDLPPVITSYLPLAASVKSNVSISGSNFNPVLNKNFVYFGQVRAKVVSGSTTSLTVEVPDGAIYDYISVLDTETKLKATTLKPFVIKVGDGQGESFTSTSFKLKTDVIPESAWAVTSGDLDDDGIAEIVIAGTKSNYGCSIYKANSANPGQFPLSYTKNSPTVAPGISPMSIRIVDLDGDGRMDMISLTDNLYVFANYSSGDCKLAFSPDMVDEHLRILHFFVGDINKDGKEDIIAAGVGEYLYIYLNNSRRGSVSFDPYIRLQMSIDASYQGNAGYGMIDLDNDGMNDLIASGSNGSKRLAAYRNLTVPGSKTLNFAPPVYFALNYEPGDLALADFDGDGRTDIISSNYNSMILIKNTSDPGRLSFGPNIEVKNNFAMRNVEAGDFDGDGKPDLVVDGGTVEKPAIHFYRNISHAGTFDQTSFDDPMTILTPEIFVIQKVADFNGDGRADVLIRGNMYGHTVTAMLQNRIGYLPVPKLSTEGKTTFFKGETVTLIADVEDGYTFKWLKDGIEIPGVTGDRYVVSASGSYQVSVVDRGNAINSNPILVNAVFHLSADNFKVSATSASCKGSNNGVIEISAVKNLNYTATITKGSSVATLPFTTSASLKDCAAGTYSVCITVENEPGFQQCFDVLVDEPKDLALYANVNQQDKTVDLDLKGAKFYTVTLNGKTYTSTSGRLSLPLEAGKSKLSVSSDLACQGKLEETLALPEPVSIYPNPVVQFLHLNIVDDSAFSANIKIFDLSGNVVYQKEHPIAREIKIDLQALNKGLYVLQVKSQQHDVKYKIYKN